MFGLQKDKKKVNKMFRNLNKPNNIHPINDPFIDACSDMGRTYDRDSTHS